MLGWTGACGWAQGTGFGGEGGGRVVRDGDHINVFIAFLTAAS